MRHSAGKNTRLRRQVSQLRHTVTTLRISKAASNDSGGEHTQDPEAYAAKVRKAMLIEGIPPQPQPQPQRELELEMEPEPAARATMN